MAHMTSLSSWTCRPGTMQHLVGSGVGSSSSKEHFPTAADQLRPGSLAEADPEDLALPETDYEFEDELLEDELLEDELAEADLEDEPLLAEELLAEESAARAGSSTGYTATKTGKPVLQLWL